MAAIHLHFGLAFDQAVAPRSTQEGGVLYAGPRRLLEWLEHYLGLGIPQPDNRHLRIAAYQQLLERHLDEHPEAFFAQSFRTDPLATAADMLDKRDALRDAGWTFAAEPGMPPRLATLCQLEAMGTQAGTTQLPPGPVERLEAVVAALARAEPCPFATVVLTEPLELLSPGWQRLFQLWADRLSAKESLPPPTHTDLGAWQARLSGRTAPKKKARLKGDGSLLVLRSRNAREAAAFLAALLRHNADFRPLLVVAADDRTLDTALAREGFPGMGIPSSSLARPPLQLLKLAQAFLWEPIQVARLLEFVSLPVVPLDPELAHHIARQLARRPGIEGPEWHQAIGAFFKRTEASRPHELAEMRRAFSFWFERKRYAREEEAPVGEVRKLYAYIERWARTALHKQASRYPSLFLLASQAAKVVELLDLWPQPTIAPLELERLVRTVFEPAPASFEPPQAGHLPWTRGPGALTGPVSDVCWWNFIEFEPTWFFDPWTPSERAWLAQRNIHPLSPQQRNSRHIFHRNRPILMARRRVLLVIPEEVDGKATLPYPLWSELEAAFDGLEAITARPTAAEAWAAHFRLPQYVPLEPLPLPRPTPYVYFKPVCPPLRPVESLSSLEALFFYPHIWVFRHWLELEDTPLFQLVDDTTLAGTLAHRVFERLFKEKDALHWDKATLDSWVTRTLDELVRQEGATLLAFGREPERIALRYTLRKAAWRLLDMLRKGGWKVKGAELQLEGPFADIRVRGIADLVLEREGECAVIDIKWGGKTRRSNLLRNEEDLQLTCYSKLISGGTGFAHTAFFIINRGEMLARNRLAFDEAHTPAPAEDHCAVQAAIWRKMENTWRWRMKQLQHGILEVRTALTSEALDRGEERHYFDFEPSQLFEMKSEDHPYDEYRVLLGLVE